MVTSKHPLEEQRGGVILGLIGAWGVGVAFMLAHVLILVGLGLCLLSLVLATSLYWRHFKASFKALSSGSKIDEIGALEVLIVFSTLVLAFPLSGYLYWMEAYTSQEVEGSARIQVDRVAFVPKGLQRYLQIQTINKGDLASSEIRIVFSAGFFSHPLEQKETDDYMSRVLTFKVKRKDLQADPQTQAGSTYFVNPYQAAVTDAELSKFYAGDVQLYIFLAAYYYDQAINRQRYYRMQFCAYLVQRLDQWNYCPGSHNDIVRLPH